MPELSYLNFYNDAPFRQVVGRHFQIYFVSRPKSDKVHSRFAINTVVDQRGRAVRVYTGDWRAAHREGCREYLVDHSTKIEAKREIVVVSCGGSPYDINLIQAHKALDMAAHACIDGGTIILVAECSDGLGQANFLKWFAEKDSSAVEARLREVSQ